jgi:phosphoribosylformylglycinamidine synthase
VVGDLPIDPLAEASPVYDRPRNPAPKRAHLSTDDVPALSNPMAALVKLMSSPNLASKAWIWDQYDQSVMADTVQGPGGDAAVVRVHGTKKALAMSTDCTPRYCAADPKEGGKQAVAETWRNITAVGALPLAVTDCLNFGNPEKPEIMAQFADCIEGMSEACRALDFPVVSGNVSFYNETEGRAIQPTPAIGGVGLLDDASNAVTMALAEEGQTLILIGDTLGHLGASLYLSVIEGRDEGAPPPVELAAERRNGDLVRGLITDGLISACHDLADGGLCVAAAEMALAGDMGAVLDDEANGAIPLHAWLFGEDQGRYLLSVDDADTVLARAAEAGVPAKRIGVTGGSRLTVGSGHAISLSELRDAHEGWLPAYMATP